MSAILDLATAPLLTLKDVGQLTRNLDCAKRAVYHGWLRPCCNTSPTGGGGGKYLYSRRDVSAFIAKLECGQVPPPLPRGKKEVPV